MKAVVAADEGQGRPLVYVPGIDGSGSMLLQAAPRLAAVFRLVRLRYVGEGEDSYAALARSVADCIEERGIARAVLLAESFGGAVALQTALDATDRVAALAIVNSFAHYTKRFNLWLSRLGAPFVGPRLFGLGRRCLGSYGFFGRMDDPEAKAAFYARPRGGFDQAYRARLRMIAGLDLRPRLGEVRQPVTLFAAGRDRIVDSLPQARRMVEALPDAELEVVPDGGHLLLPLAELPWERWLDALCVRGGMRA